MANQPSITSMIHTEQTLTRDFQVDASSGEWDMPISYRKGTFRPTGVILHFRVNRGATQPYWYLFNAKLRMAMVLKSGEVSGAYPNIRTESFNPENLPVWVKEMAQEMLPQAEPEGRIFSNEG